MPHLLQNGGQRSGTTQRLRRASANSGLELDKRRWRRWTCFATLQALELFVVTSILLPRPDMRADAGYVSPWRRFQTRFPRFLITLDLHSESPSLAIPCTSTHTTYSLPLQRHGGYSITFTLAVYLVQLRWALSYPIQVHAFTILSTT